MIMNASNHPKRKFIAAILAGLFLIVIVAVPLWTSQINTFKLMYNGVPTTAIAVAKTADTTRFGFTPPLLTNSYKYTVKYKTNDGNGMELKSTVSELIKDSRFEKMNLPFNVDIMYDRNDPQITSLTVEIPKSFMEYFLSNFIVFLFQFAIVGLVFFFYRSSYMEYINERAY